jgi:alcohol dehydrogenase YqhD (iron-dependent ADH family)
MRNYTWNRPVKILFGPGQLNNLGTVLKDMGKKCFLMIGGGSVIKNGYLDRVTLQLKKKKIDWVLFGGVEINPTTNTVERAAKLLVEEQCTFIIGLGGGSVMDAAKLTACAARNPGPIWDYIRRDEEQKEPKKGAVPVICISTFAATGSEANINAVVTNPETGEKIALKHDAIIPRVSIVDPELTLTLPPEATATGGIDIICHAMENYWSQKNFDTPLQDRICESVMRTVVEWLPRALENGKNMEARNNLALASSYAMLGMQQGQDGSYPLHMMEHPLSGICNITHGLGLAALIPALFRHNMKNDCRMLATMGRNVFGVTAKNNITAAVKAEEAFTGWIDDNGLLKGLKSLGVRARFLKRAAQLAVGIFPGDVIPNINPLERDDVINIYNESM